MNVRIIQSFKDLDLLEQLEPVCANCLHSGNVIDVNLLAEKSIRDREKLINQPYSKFVSMHELINGENFIDFYVRKYDFISKQF